MVTCSTSRKPRKTELALLILIENLTTLPNNYQRLVTYVKPSKDQGHLPEQSPFLREGLQRQQVDEVDERRLLLVEEHFHFRLRKRKAPKKIGRKKFDRPSSKQEEGRCLRLIEKPPVAAAVSNFSVLPGTKWSIFRN